MATFTPSSSSNFIAGGFFWLLGWILFFEFDDIIDILPDWLKAFLGLTNESTRNAQEWVVNHKVLTFASTEMFNYILNGINPLAVTFALGGTLVNGLMIFAVMPLIHLFRFKKARKDFAM